MLGISGILAKLSSLRSMSVVDKHAEAYPFTTQSEK